MKKDMKDNTDVQIAFKEVFLESCKNKGFSKKEMMTLDDEKLIYISPSDHEILDISIQFTKYDWFIGVYIEINNSLINELIRCIQKWPIYQFYQL